MRPLRVLHIITGLGMGGAENSLLNLLTHTDRAEFNPEVLSLSTLEPIGPRIQALDIPTYNLGMTPGRIMPGDIFRLAAFVRAQQPDVIQTWMYHADLLGGLAAPLAGRPPVCWGIHLSPRSLKELKMSTRGVVRLNAVFSRILPAKIVCCAESARTIHAQLGYDSHRMRVISNGFDLTIFRPDPAARSALRQMLNLPAETPLVGMAARFDPHKDHANFIQAAALLQRELPRVHFVLWGREVDSANPALMDPIRAAGLEKYVHMLGLRTDAPHLTAALDVATLSSVGEAFPMVVGEAMACGVPCAVTDVGDAARLVGDTGRVVPPRDPAALARAWSELLQLPAVERSALGQRARQRIQDHFSIAQTTAAYSKLYLEVSGRRV